VIEIIGINPFVFIPENILENIFEQAGKNKGPIPVKGIRYISFLKTEESIDINIKKAIDFLMGRGRFAGRNNP
jgi:hypothetical protein